MTPTHPSLQTYRAAHPGLAIRVYFLAYKDSVEEQKYLSEIRREKDAFVRLIEEKGVRPCSLSLSVCVVSGSTR